MLEKIEAHADLMEKRTPKRKKDNVVHLNYISRIIDENDLEIIRLIRDIVIDLNQMKWSLIKY